MEATSTKTPSTSPFVREWLLWGFTTLVALAALGLGIWALVEVIPRAARRGDSACHRLQNTSFRALAFQDTVSVAQGGTGCSRWSDVVASLPWTAPVVRGHVQANLEGTGKGFIFAEGGTSLYMLMALTDLTAAALVPVGDHTRRLRYLRVGRLLPEEGGHVPTLTLTLYTGDSVATLVPSPVQVVLDGFEDASGAPARMQSATSTVFVDVPSQQFVAVHLALSVPGEVAFYFQYELSHPDQP